MDWFSGQGLTYNNEQERETLRWCAVEPY